MYSKYAVGGNILAVAMGECVIGEEVTQTEYELIKHKIDNMPTPPDGYVCVLKTDYEYSIEEKVQEKDKDPKDWDADTADYEAALRRMGVKT